MHRKHGYPAVDVFRIVAAVLVVAIHTAPLEQTSLFADYLVTRVWGRIAVPFFLMTTGFFVFSKLEVNKEKTLHALKKTGRLYGAAILLYLPLNLYNSYFSGTGICEKIIQDLLFDGTFYHLWYFPAVMTGIGIVYLLLKKVGEWKSLWICFVLYVIGLFGDSYYGIVKGIPVIGTCYRWLFQMFDYTRNGIFFVPLFLILGAFFSKWKIKNQKVIAAGLVLSFAAMSIEGSILYVWQVQRHDSMYIMLVPTMICLFSALIRKRGERLKRYGSISMIVYVIHPWIIVVTRMAAKVLRLETILVKNQVIQFVVVVCFSFLTAEMICMIKDWKGTKEWIEKSGPGLKSIFRH